LSCPLSVGERLLVLPRLGVMLGHQLWLGLDRLGKALLEHVRNPMVDLLAGAPEQ
jgi:hypothetical protein